MGKPLQAKLFAASESAPTFTKAAFLTTLNSGEWLKSKDLLDRMHMHFPEVEYIDPYNLLAQMVQRRFLVGRGQYRGNKEYTVTSDCVIPPTITMKELQQAMKGTL
jgi:hypothetical protein